MPKVKAKFQIGYGPEKNLPNLLDRELGYTTDTDKIFLRVNQGNVELAKKEDVNGLPERVATLETNKAEQSYVDEQLEAVNSSLADVATNFISLGIDNTGVRDDTTKIINAISQPNKTFLALGTFLVSSELVPAKNTKIYGLKGYTKFIQKDGSDFPRGLFPVINEGVKISDIELQGSLVGTTPGDAINDGIRVNGAIGFELKNIYSHGFQGNGIRVTNNSKGSISDIESAYNKRNGILINNSEVTKRNIETHHNGTSALDHGVYISGDSGNGSERTSLIGLKSYNNIGAGLQVNQYSKHVTLDNIECFSNGTNGVILTSGNGTDDISLSIGTMKAYSNTNYGFYITGNANTKCNMAVGALYAESNGKSGAYFEQLRESAISLIKSRLNGEHGVQFKGTTGSPNRDNVISTIVAEDNSQSLNNGFNGIEMDNCVRNTIGSINIKNNLTNKHKYGIHLIDTTGACNLNKFGFGDIYGNATNDFKDESVAKTSSIYAVLGDGSYPVDAKSTKQSSVFTFSTTESTIVQSVETYQPGRYFVMASGRLYGGVGQGKLLLYLGSTLVQDSGAIDVTTNRDIATLQGVVVLTVSDKLKLNGLLTSGTISAADFQISIMRI
ncbi:hypothetical protein V7150_16060 [Neobacillus drentensis]|uniref:hypothetical protein n=1 Tax=Neobacillus drentensis TaxID=220684 RepID=UPI002FFFB99B